MNPTCDPCQTGDHTACDGSAWNGPADDIDRCHCNHTQEDRMDQDETRETVDTAASPGVDEVIVHATLTALDDEGLDPAQVIHLGRVLHAALVPSVAVMLTAATEQGYLRAVRMEGEMEREIDRLTVGRDEARAALDIQTALLEDARAALETVKDRMDDFAYDELAGPLDDGATDKYGVMYRSQRTSDRAALDRVRALMECAPVMTYDNGYRVQAVDKANLLGVIPLATPAPADAKDGGR